ncbi:MAG: IS21 family transposase [bacterium]|nr:IS21 family transposase [bacterium]
MKIDRKTVFDIKRLADEGKSVRRISELTGANRKTVKRYVENPFPERPSPKRKSKLDPFGEDIKRFLEKDPKVSAVVIKQKLDKLGYDGGITILKNRLRKLRKPREKQAFIRFESGPGEQMQVDWGHFGSLSYGNYKRKLYAMCVVECHSRLLCVEFTHSQNQATLHQSLLNAFLFFGGTPERLVVDNMLTAVTERCGPVIRFNDAFLDFLMRFKIAPYACNPGAPYEKGKIENAVKYVRHNFIPLREFSDLPDVQSQVGGWMNTVANVRNHQTTGEQPLKRFEKIRLNPLPEVIPDVRETQTVMVHKDFAVRFDANAYTVPPFAVGRHVTIRADQHTVEIYDRSRRLAAHKRCFSKKVRVELPTHREQVKKLHGQLWRDRQIALFLSLGEETADYLRGLADGGQPIKKDILRLLSLRDEYGAASVLIAIRKCIRFKAFGADYVENILYQEMTPVRKHPKVRLGKAELDGMRLCEPSLAGYDAHIIKKRNGDDKKNH